MKSIRIELPEEILELFQEHGLGASLKKWAVLKQVRAGKLSSGRMAEILETTGWDFMELMSSHGLPLVNFPIEELDRQIRENAGK